MHIGIASPVTINEFLDYLNVESQEKARDLRGLKAPSVDTLIHGLIERGHFISIYTLTTEVESILVLEGNQLKIFVAPYRKQGWKRALDLFHKESKNIENLINLDSNLPDIINANWTYEFARGVSKFASRTPVLVTVHDWSPKVLQLNPNYYWLSRYILNTLVFKTRGFNFVANSPYIADRINKKWNFSIGYIPNAISNVYLSQKRRNKSEHGLRIIAVSNNVSKAKNIKKLLLAFQNLKLLIPVAELRLIGLPFVESNKIIRNWSTLNLLDGVSLLGSIDHRALIDEYDNADILVHPSLEESFGNVLIEAMARKLPVIGGSHSGAVPFVLGNGKAGLLCDVTSVNAICEAILILYNDSLLRNELINYGESLVKTIYLEETVIEQTITLYKDIILKHK